MLQEVRQKVEVIRSMKNLKEKVLARQVMLARLGFAPALDNIQPLESTGYYGQCDYVLFYVKGHEETIYRADIGGYLLISNHDKELNVRP